LICCRDIPLEEFEYTLNVNLKASFILVKGVIEGMKAQEWGRIIFMSSIAAYGGGINGCRKFQTVPQTLSNVITDYAASKGGLTGMMKNLASKLAPLNISVNDVAPALIGETGMIPTADVIPGGSSSIHLGRLGTTQEVANVVGLPRLLEHLFHFGMSRDFRLMMHVLRVGDS
jgi:3-oxoacyl-[acyl-carrier protein] reductase